MKSVSYRSAPLLVDSMNSLFGRSVISEVVGGRGAGSVMLPEFGAEVIRRYSVMVWAARPAVTEDPAGVD